MPASQGLSPARGMTLSAAAEIGHLTPIRFGYYLKQKMRSAVITSIVKLFTGDPSVSFFEIYPLDDSFSLRG